MSVIKLTNIGKSFGDICLFNKFNLEIKKDEFVSIMGPSGSGKSTLLNIIGLLENPDSGDLYIKNYKNPKFHSKKGRQLLKNNISYLFQNYGLVDNQSVHYNLRMSTYFLKMSKKEEKDKMIDALTQVGLDNILDQKIYRLSGGEQQRIALAKIILKPSDIILADEPTGSLDDDNRDSILNIIKSLNKKGKTIIVVTHDSVVEQSASRNIRL